MLSPAFRIAALPPKGSITRLVRVALSGQHCRESPSVLGVAGVAGYRWRSGIHTGAIRVVSCAAAYRLRIHLYGWRLGTYYPSSARHLGISLL